MSYENIKYKNNGLSLVEVVLASSLFLIVVMGLSGALLYGQESTRTSGGLARAGFLADEGLSALRNMRDSGYSNMTNWNSGGIGITKNNNQWEFSATNAVDGFTRETKVSSFGYPHDRAQVTAEISWQQTLSRLGFLYVRTHFTNWRRSIETGGSWDNNSNLVNIFSDSALLEGVEKIKTFGNYAYVIGSGTGSPEFRVYDISNPASPTMVGSLSLFQNASDLTVSADGQIVYLSVKHPFIEIDAINVSIPSSPQHANWVDIPSTQVGWPDEIGDGVDFYGSHIFLTRPNSNNDPDFFVLDSSLAVVSSINITGNPHEIVVSGNYAYVAVSGTADELAVVDISNLASPSVISSLDVGSSNNAHSISMFESSILIDDNGFLKVVSVSNPSNPTLSGSLDTGGSAIFDIASEFSYSANGKRYGFLSSNNVSKELITFNITNVTNPVMSSTYNYGTVDGFRGLSYHADFDKLFVGLSDASNDVAIFAPDPI